MEQDNYNQSLEEEEEEEETYYQLSDELSSQEVKEFTTQIDRQVVNEVVNSNKIGRGGGGNEMEEICLSGDSIDLESQGLRDIQSMTNIDFNQVDNLQSRNEVNQNQREDQTSQIMMNTNVEEEENFQFPSNVIIESVNPQLNSNCQQESKNETQSEGLEDRQPIITIGQIQESIQKQEPNDFIENNEEGGSKLNNEKLEMENVVDNVKNENENNEDINRREIPQINLNTNIETNNDKDDNEREQKNKGKMKDDGILNIEIESQVGNNLAQNSSSSSTSTATSISTSILTSSFSRAQGRSSMFPLETEDDMEMMENVDTSMIKQLEIDLGHNLSQAPISRVNMNLNFGREENLEDLNSKIQKELETKLINERKKKLETEQRNRDEQNIPFEINRVPFAPRHDPILNLFPLNDNEGQDDEFQPPPQQFKKGLMERKNSSESFEKESKKQKVEKIEKEEKEEKEASACQICYEQWTLSGTHRVVSLKCGHLYGKSCIEKWISLDKQTKCPQCNTKAIKKDIRPIYATVITAIDSSERDQAVKIAEEEKKKTLAAKENEAKAILNYQICKSECERLRNELTKLTKRNTFLEKQIINLSIPSINTRCDIYQFRFRQSFLISKEKTAKILTFDPSQEILVASKSDRNQKSGVVKASLLDPLISSFFPLHSSSIKDLKASPRNDSLLLSASLDKDLVISNLNSNLVIQRYSTESGVWSCCWDSLDFNSAICGLQNNSILFFDIRNTRSYFDKIPFTGKKKLPIHSLINLNSPNHKGPKGLLAGTLEGIFFWKKNEIGKYVCHTLDDDLGNGFCTSVDYDQISQKFLVSFRNTKSSQKPLHRIGRIEENGELKIEKEIEGEASQKLLSKSCLFSTPANSLLQNISTSNINSNSNSTTKTDAKFLSRFMYSKEEKENKRERENDSEERQENDLFVATADGLSQSLYIWDVNKKKLSQKLDTNNSQPVDTKPFSISKSQYLASLTEESVFIHRWEN